MVEYKEERFGDFFEEMKALLDDHYQELSVTKVFGLNPNYDRYLELQDSGDLFCLTCRKDGELIGYIIYFVYRHLHYWDCLTAMEDVYFIRKDQRQGRIGLNLFKEAEKALKEHGVNRINISCKVHLDHTKIFEHLGYKFIEKHFTKLLD